MRDGPIIIIDDDEDDMVLFQKALADLGVHNEIVCFNSGSAFWDYMETADTPAFFIACDINMSPFGGLEIKGRMFEDERLMRKLIPFLFFSSSRSSSAVEKAYAVNAQGFFLKPKDFRELVETFRAIIDYWGRSQHPNSKLDA